MIRFLLLLLLIPFQISAAIRLELDVVDKEINQGEIIPARIKLDLDSYQKLSIVKLNGLTVAESLHIISTSPAVKTSEEAALQLDSRIIFLKVPDTQVLQGELNGIPVQIYLGSFEVKPTEVPEDFIFSNFTISERSRWIIYVTAALLGLMIFFYPALQLYKAHTQKKKKLLREKELIGQMVGCQKYEDVVEMWKKKHHYLSTFPHLKDPFSKLETTLFKVQFKPMQTESEKIEVMNSYRTFRAEVEGGPGGV